MMNMHMSNFTGDSQAHAGNGLPSDFDLSRFGPHVQAAYRGPTPDNPSMSLKKRLARARALDQRERSDAPAIGGNWTE